MAEENEIPLCCNIAAFNAAQRQRHNHLAETLAQLTQGFREVALGYEFDFLDDLATVQAVTEWITLERLCCPFFDMDLHWAGRGGKVRLRLTGREGAKAVMQEEFQAWLSH